MGKYFGTDGFRGEANATLTGEHAWHIGHFLAWYYGSGRGGTVGAPHRARVVIGKDTRRSSYLFEYTLVAGLIAGGADAYMLHVTTTPGVCFAAARGEFDCGVMISASHNPFSDNGIKLVNGDGEKIDDAAIKIIEDYLDGGARALGLDSDELPLAHGADIGQIVDYAAGRNRYVGYLISLAAHSYRSLRIGLDCANGSAWMIAKAVFEALGAHTYIINADPDGLNINLNAGSTHTEGLRQLVLSEHLDAGFAFDGDADRCIAVDENGEEIDGDKILYILACAMRENGTLPRNTVVTTVMTNLGLYRALDAAGIRHEETTVGDRYIYECMTRGGYGLGGEQSGHVILRKYATTGDGLLTAILLAERMTDTKTPLSRLAAPVVLSPQMQKSIRVPDKDAVLADPAVKQRLSEIAARLGSSGRILLRRSGTEPVVRVMVDSPSPALCDGFTDEMLALIRARGLAEKN
jgi:phosphoglucosamine mutase